MTIIQSDKNIISSRSKTIRSRITALEEGNKQATFGNFTTVNPNTQMQNVQQEATSLHRHYYTFLRRDMKHIENIAHGFEKLDHQIAANARKQ